MNQRSETLDEHTRAPPYLINHMEYFYKPVYPAPDSVTHIRQLPDRIGQIWKCPK